MSLKIKFKKIYTNFNSNGSVTNLDISSCEDSLIEAKCKVLLSHRVKETRIVEKIGYVYSQSRPDSGAETSKLVDEDSFNVQAKTRLVYKFSDDCELKLGDSLEFICYKRKGLSIRFEICCYSKICLI